MTPLRRRRWLATGLALACVACNEDGALPVVDQGHEAGPDGGVDLAPLASAIEVPSPADPTRIDDVALIYNAPHYVVVWEEIPVATGVRTLRLARLTTEGELAAPASQIAVPFDVNPSHLKLMAVPDGYRTWYRGTINETRLYAQKIDPTGQALGSAISVATMNSRLRRGGIGVAFDGDRFGACWEDLDPETDPQRQQIYFSTVSVDLATISLPKVLWPNTKVQTAPYLTWQKDNEAFVAIWDEWHALQIAQLDRQGEVKTAPQTITFKGQKISGVPLDGGSTLLWWSTDDHSTERLFMPLKGVTPVGDPFQLYEKNRYDSADTTVGVWGTRLLLAWQSTTSSALPQILTREFDGSNLPPSALPSATILSDDRYRFRRPAVAGSPAGFALVFVGEVLGSHRLYLRLIE